MITKVKQKARITPKAKTTRAQKIYHLILILSFVAVLFFIQYVSLVAHP